MFSLLLVNLDLPWSRSIPLPLLQELRLLVDLLADASIVFEQLVLLLLEEVVP